MWLNCTRTRVKPLDVGRVVSILSSEPCMIPLRTATGFRGLFLVEFDGGAGGAELHHLLG